MTLTLKVLFHDSCFDGTASAAVFTRFFRERVEPGARVVYAGLQHGAGDPFPPGVFDGDVNACVDFRYSSSPRLGWWFDHHGSAFPTPEDRAHFEADTSGRKFHDPGARSNTAFMVRVLAERHGFDAGAHQELIHWAEIIDGAQFPDARTAVALEEPALRLMTWIEHNRDPALAARYIEDLQAPGARLTDLAAASYVAGPLAPVLERHRRDIDLIRGRAVERAGVVYFDLSDEPVEAYNKFIAYMLFPGSRYSVAVTRSASRAKVSVGSNPWSPVPRTHDLSRICERYGGGGHPVVGAISLAPGEVARARAVAAEVVEELQRG